MSNPSASNAAGRPHDVLAAFLSYLVPGLGQIYQRRVAKGLLFMVCLYAMFFYGMWLGSWCNVYLPDTAERNNPWRLTRPLANLYNRLQFAGQFWIGIAAWPAIWQYNELSPPVSKESSPFLYNFQKQPPETRHLASEDWRRWREEGINELQANGDKSWDLAWVYTVIAGVLNILVIYDAFAGPTFDGEPHEDPLKREAVPT